MNGISKNSQGFALTVFYIIQIFLDPVQDTIHILYPFPLRPALQILGHAPGGGYLLNEQAVAFLCLCIQVGKVGV